MWDRHRDGRRNREIWGTQTDSCLTYGPRVVVRVRGRGRASSLSLDLNFWAKLVASESVTLLGWRLGYL